MRHLIMIAALALSACALGPQTSPGHAGQTPAQSTRIDEQLALGVEAAYKVERTAIEAAVDAGLVKGDLARQLASIDRTAYAAVAATRVAYNAAQTLQTPTGNLTYVQAAQGATAAIASALSLLAQAGVR